MNTHPKMLESIEHTLSAARLATNDHAAHRYIEALVHKAFVAGWEVGYERGEERDGDSTKDWEQYEG